MRSGRGVGVGGADLEAAPSNWEWIDRYVGGSINVDCGGRQG